MAGRLRSARSVMIRAGHLLKSRPLYECENRACRHQTSVIAGTVFHGTHKPLRLWFYVMFLMVASKSGVAATTVMRLMGISYSTAWTWLHKLRKAMVRPERPKLQGKVEIDESYIGGVKARFARSRYQQPHRSLRGREAGRPHGARRASREDSSDRAGPRAAGGH